MSEKNIQSINDMPKKENLFHLTIPEMASINKLLSYGYKLVDETDRDIHQYLKKKRIQEKKMKKKKYHVNKQAVIDKKLLTEKIRHLPEKQLKGIINLIDLKKEGIEQKEFFELDIENLNYDRLEELKRYVTSCIKTSGDSIPARYLEEFKKNKKDNQLDNLETV